MIKYSLTITQGYNSVTMEFDAVDGTIPNALWTMCETALCRTEDTEIKIKRIQK